MSMEVKNVPVRLLITVAILLLLIALVIGLQCSLGRYTASFGGEVSFSPHAKGIFQLNYDEWSVLRDGDGQQLSLRITNGASASDVVSDQVRIRLYVPATDASFPTVSLHQDGGEYLAVVSAIPKGTAAYKLYGAGSICCFYGADGGELMFDLPDSATQSLDATLTVADKEIDTSGFQLIVETVNTDRNGGDRL